MFNIPKSYMSNVRVTNCFPLEHHPVGKFMSTAMERAKQNTTIWLSGTLSSALNESLILEGSYSRVYADKIRSWGLSGSLLDPLAERNIKARLDVLLILRPAGRLTQHSFSQLLPIHRSNHCTKSFQTNLPHIIAVSSPFTWCVRHWSDRSSFSLPWAARRSLPSCSRWRRVA